MVLKIGCVSIEEFKDSYRLRWTYLSKRYSLTVQGGITKDSKKAAIAKANIITGDISLDKFDTTLAKYSPKHFQSISSLFSSILEVWNYYKTIKITSVALTTQKESWSKVNRALDKLPATLLLLSSHDRVFNYLCQFYAPFSVYKVCKQLDAAINLSFKNHKIDRKYGYNSSVPITPSITSNKSFTEKDIKNILLAFNSNKYTTQYSKYKDSYYYNFVLMLSLTGRRPEDVIALTWDDVKDKHIIFSKAYSNGILKTTKNNKVTNYPINAQLRALINNLPKTENKLLFPSQKDTYIDLHNFTNRYWRRIVPALVVEGLVQEYLPLYNLRHTRATQLIRAGVDLQTVAVLLETSISMLSRHYLEGDTDIELPEVDITIDTFQSQELD
jgi:integrase